MVFESPRGPDAWGQRFVGKDAVRSAFAARYAGIPDVPSTDDTHFVAGDRGVSLFALSGTAGDERLEFHGCDIWTFRGDEIVIKDSHWKIRTPG